METARERLIRYLYTCSAISLAAGVYGPLTMQRLEPRMAYLSGAGLVVTGLFPILVWRLEIT